MHTLNGGAVYGVSLNKHLDSLGGYLPRVVVVCFASGACLNWRLFVIARVPRPPTYLEGYK